MTREYPGDKNSNNVVSFNFVKSSPSNASETTIVECLEGLENLGAGNGERWVGSDWTLDVAVAAATVVTIFAVVVFVVVFYVVVVVIVVDAGGGIGGSGTTVFAADWTLRAAGLLC